MHLRTLFPCTILFAAVMALPAQVKYSPETMSVDVNGKPFTTYNPGKDVGKPFLAPLRSASGKIVTRHWPMENVEGESRDHVHHTGLWFSYDDVNGVKFWENDPSYTKPNMGRIVVKNAEWKGNVLNATMEWRDTAGKVLLVEDRAMTFVPDPKVRIIDFQITLTAAADKVTFGDTKEGAFAIRLAEPFTERKGGKMVNAEGLVGMAKVWGKRSNWVDYT